MGLNQSQQSVIFLTIANGKIVRQFKEATPTSVSRVNKVGREVHEEFYDSLTGIITDITTRESEYGKSWIVKLKSDENYQIEFNYSGGYASTFLKALPNVQFSKELTLAPKLFIEGDKKKSVMFINQNGQGLKHYFTKDNPNGMPDLSKIKIKGKESWDDSDRMEFLENYVMTNILPLLKPQISDVTSEEVPF